VKLLQFPFDNVVIDRFLPDLDATEVAEQIRQLFPQIEVELMDSRRAQESGESRSAQSALGKREASVESEEGAHTAEAIAAGGVAVAGAPRFEDGGTALPGMIGSSRAVQQVYRLVRMVAGPGHNGLNQGRNRNDEKSWWPERFTS
jgi:DNA-binding NtrC family response regulator